MTGPVRPYVITGGRIPACRSLLAVESLVSAVPAAAPDPDAVNQEQRRILTLCRSLLSVAEISAHLRLPISVVSVLVGDLRELGAVQVLPPAPRSKTLPDALLEEVLVGLRQRR